MFSVKHTKRQFFKTYYYVCILLDILTYLILVLDILCKNIKEISKVLLKLLTITTRSNSFDLSFLE